jgi:hypothetical protein
LVGCTGEESLALSKSFPATCRLVLLNASSNRVDAMNNPWKVSAQFAAFVWYSNRQTDKKATVAEAAQFAKENWVAFLPYAHEGYGRLLIKLAQPKIRKVQPKRVSSTSRRRVARSDLALTR